MSDSPVSLATLIQPSKTVSIEFAGYSGFNVSLCHLGREELLKLRKKCTTNKFNRSTHKPEEHIDEDIFVVEYCKAVIKGWSGLKYRYLEEFLLVDVSNFDPDDELPYTEENAQLLMKNSSDFDGWVSETVGDLENFSKVN